MEVPKLGVKLELYLPAYATATETWDQSRICDLYHSLWQHWILNPLNRLGIEFVSLWMLVRFISDESQWEHPRNLS